MDCFCNGIEFTQSHRSEEAIPDSYDKFEPGLKRQGILYPLKGYKAKWISVFRAKRPLSGRY